MTRKTPSPPSSPSLNSETALDLLKRQKAKIMKLVEEQRFTEEDIEPWRTHTISLIEQALGSNMAGNYYGAFHNWQTNAYTYGEDEEMEHAEDAKKAIPRAVNTLTQVIAYSDPSRPLIPTQVGHPFRTEPGH